MMMAWQGLNYDVTNNCYFVLTVHKTFCGKAKKRFCQPQLLTKRRQSAIAIDYKDDDGQTGNIHSFGVESCTTTEE